MTVIPHLISYCNSCLQALLPQQTSSLSSHLSFSPQQLTKSLASHDSPHAQAPERAASNAAASLADLASDSAHAHACTGSGSPTAPEAVADVPVEKVKGADLKGPGLERPALEGPLGQALAEAAVEVVLAVLSNSEDSGQHFFTNLLDDAHFACHAFGMNRGFGMSLAVALASTQD